MTRAALGRVLLVATCLALVVVGLALIYLPLGIVSAGIAAFALLYFDPDNAARFRWPR